ncbi:hypothetical protein B0T14DRAFT_539424 [Immersiella caudata]|uniref:protein-ribulosamine 3-kinase n=1 Tax=Immersiella caudata TaxID=314043 RepID=A0AA39WDY8_9PEZI|nr:hypothetical protein B0T14DRAFT_539424 [Immersiella caudata]
MNYNGTGDLEFGEDNTNVDSVTTELPEGCKIASTSPHGISFWASTGRIDVLLRDGTPQSFFIKVLSNDTGRNMVRSEFESMRAIQRVLPELNTMPDPDTLGSLLAALHSKSTSPNGKFGFHIPTHAGNVSHMRYALDLEIEKIGPEEELEVLSQALFDKVIPRLLRLLESDGRRVKPSLVHGDLWYANSGVDKTNGRNFVFDACSFYAHNEYEFGQWRLACNKKFAEASAPKEDFEGRLDLYRLRFGTHVSALFMDRKHLRPQ